MSYYFYYYLRYSSLVRNIVQYFAAWLAESLRHNGNTYMGIQYSTVQKQGPGIQKNVVQYNTVQEQGPHIQSNIVPHSSIQ